MANKAVLPNSNVNALGSSSKVWEQGYFKKIYDNTGDEYVHRAETDKLGFSVVDGALCQTYEED